MPPAQDIQTLTVDSDGQRIFVKTIGFSCGSSVTIVLLHDGLGSVAAWKDFPERLAASTGARVVAYDRPGHGLSPFPRSGALALDHEADVVLPNLLRSLGIRRPVFLGHSDGGTIALLAAARLDPVAVITEAAHVFMEPTMRVGIRQLMAEWRDGALRQRLSRYQGPDAARMFERWSSTWLLPRFDSWSVVNGLHEVTAPVLAVQGDADNFGTPAQLDVIAKNCVGPVRIAFIPNCGHVPHHEQPDTFLNHVQAHLETVIDAPCSRRSAL